RLALSRPWHSRSAGKSKLRSAADQAYRYPATASAAPVIAKAITSGATARWPHTAPGAQAIARERSASITPAPTQHRAAVLTSAIRCGADRTAIPEQPPAATL